MVDLFAKFQSEKNQVGNSNNDCVFAKTYFTELSELIRSCSIDRYIQESDVLLGKTSSKIYYFPDETVVETRRQIALKDGPEGLQSYDFNGASYIDFVTQTCHKYFCNLARKFSSYDKSVVTQLWDFDSLSVDDALLLVDKDPSGEELFNVLKGEIFERCAVSSETMEDSDDFHL